jgi:DNA-directed RNA polymerase subunit N (RpoN/RPB10)
MKVVLPPCCLHCGMPLNNKLMTYTGMLQRGVPAGAAMDALDVKRLCCRTDLMTAAEDTRLNRVLPEKPTFVDVKYHQTEGGQPMVMPADGHTEDAPW